jgi:uncharacterized repeat protein (TIGR03803 family)
MAAFVTRASLLALVVAPAVAKYDRCNATPSVEKVIYQFAGGASGSNPTGALAIDPVGNLYGAAEGGANGCGVIFKVTPKGSETIVYAFKCAAAGMYPRSTLIRAPGDLLFGTTFEGGEACNSEAPLGCGTVFQVDKRGAETVLYTFTGQQDGWEPSGSLVRDKAGNLYGTTVEGGANLGGTLFELSPTGSPGATYQFSVLAPYSIGAISLDEAGNIYGLTQVGGSNDQGALYKVTPTGVRSLLYSFTGGADGSQPLVPPTLDSAGNIYGVASQGGGRQDGTIFKFDTSDVLTVLHTFIGSDGATPTGTLALGAKGILFGTAYYGGGNGDGSAYALASDGTLKVRYSFEGSLNVDGRYPIGNLVRDRAGYFYGVTFQGGQIVCQGGCGTVFRMAK